MTRRIPEEGPEWLTKKRENALAAFESSEMPSFRYGLDIQTHFDVDFAKVRPEKADVKMMADSNVVVLPFAKALESHEGTIKKFFGTSVKPDSKLRAFNLALFSTGTFVYVPKGVEATVPASVFYDSRSDQIDYTLIVMEPNSSLTLVEKHAAQCSYRSGISEVFLQEGAKLNYVTVQQLGECSNFNVRKATLGKDARIKWLDCTFGSSVNVMEIITHLRERGSGVKNLGVFYGTGNQHFDIYANTVHDAPNTECDMFTRGVLQDSATAIYRGLIEVKQNAPQTNSYQKEDMLLLSENARAVPVPRLDINNNDVRCTHGATVSQLDQDQLFYLMSRGLAYNQARDIIVSGFFEPVMRQLAIGEVNESVRKLVAANLR